MVAYSFKTMFGPQVSALMKRQTVRADRKRHARPGEPVQLYQGMRTRNCVKLVDPDPICVRVRPIAIVTTWLLEEFIASIVIDGRSPFIATRLKRSRRQMALASSTSATAV
ncbi:hypothetical protein [Mesorhizobium sp.]|uniref:hypothetical protein n=1 Tax=Mesorhizobium sp. TaxID=1871066 RepID=UPI0025F3B13C|nr:hypothetical protein [Mesorhizobium sp.]